MSRRPELPGSRQLYVARVKPTKRISGYAFISSAEAAERNRTNITEDVQVEWIEFSRSGFTTSDLAPFTHRKTG